MKHIIDECKSPVTVLCFGHLSLDLLAFASADGNVWLADISDGARVSKVRDFALDG